MTGYGEASRPLGEGGGVRVEIRTVNHRFLNTSFRLPPGCDRLEADIQAWIRPFVSRGHVQLVVALEGGAQGKDGPLPELDLARARHFAGELRRLREELGLAGDPDVQALVRFDLFRTPDAAARGPAVEPALLRELIEEAAAALVRGREAEGVRLRADLEERLRVLTEEAERIAALAPERLVRERDRLRAAVAELAGGVDVDEERIAREIAYMAERWDVNEELVRLRSHLDWFRETLAQDEPDPVGKRLSFVIQEMHREVNTIGSKANDAEIGRATVAMKEEIERLREQVENVE